MQTSTPAMATGASSVLRGSLTPVLKSRCESVIAIRVLARPYVRAAGRRKPRRYEVRSST
jgi:hypothetical protein